MKLKQQVVPGSIHAMALAIATGAYPTGCGRPAADESDRISISRMAKEGILLGSSTAGVRLRAIRSPHPKEN